MSERDRFSLIGHAQMPLMNALSEDELASLLDGADLRVGDRVLDLGGGRADLARRCVSRFGCTAISVDRSPAACEMATARAGSLAIEVLCQEARTYLEHTSPMGLGLAAALGALHAFGSGLPSWTTALEALRPRARHVLVGDLVALGPVATREMDVATMPQITRLLSGVTSRIVLGPERVIAYERAWCDAIEAYLRDHPHDPREPWAEDRIAWSRAPERAEAWNQLAFVAMLVPGDHRAKNA